MFHIILCTWNTAYFKCTSHQFYTVLHSYWILNIAVCNRTSMQHFIFQCSSFPFAYTVLHNKVKSHMIILLTLVIKVPKYLITYSTINWSVVFHDVNFRYEETTFSSRKFKNVFIKREVLSSTFIWWNRRNW